MMPLVFMILALLLIRKRKRRWSLSWAARFVAKWEGFLRVATWDNIASPPVLTVAYGHTKYAGAPIPFEGMTVTEAEGMNILTGDLRETAKAVDRMFKDLGVRPTIRQRIAFISGAYNCGTGILLDPDIRTPLRKGNWKAVAREWEDWSHAGGVVVEGLLNRRRSEAWMMLHPIHPHNPHKPRRGERRAVRAEKKPKEA